MRRHRTGPSPSTKGMEAFFGGSIKGTTDELWHDFMRLLVMKKLAVPRNPRTAIGRTPEALAFNSIRIQARRYPPASDLSDRRKAHRTNFRPSNLNLAHVARGATNSAIWRW